MTSSHRLEDLLTCQQQLRKESPRANRHHLFEIELAIEEITSGGSNSHTATVERWAHHLLFPESSVTA